MPEPLAGEGQTDPSIALGVTKCHFERSEAESRNLFFWGTGFFA